MQWLKFGRVYSVKCLLVAMYFNLYRRGTYKSLRKPVERK